MIQITIAWSYLRNQAKTIFSCCVEVELIGSYGCNLKFENRVNIFTNIKDAFMKRADFLKIGLAGEF